jgi:hypothetical protein
MRPHFTSLNAGGCSSDPDDEELFEALGRGEFNISGFQNKDLRRRVKGKNTGQVSRLMKRLRTHGLIKKIGRTYKYYLTSLGKQVTALGRQLGVGPRILAEREGAVLVHGDGRLPMKRGVGPPWADLPQQRTRLRGLGKPGSRIGCSTP